MRQFISLSVFLFVVLHPYSQIKNKPSLKEAPAAIQSVLQDGLPYSASTIRIPCGTNVGSRHNLLFIIDGVPHEENQIENFNSEDIETIEVLKSTAENSFLCYTANRDIILITTKKAHRRKFVIRDATNLSGIGSASIKAVFDKTGKQFQFTADEFGRIETDSLKSIEYTITVSSTGYKTKTIGLKAILQNKGEITLERAFIELKEVMIVAYPTIRCRSMISTCLPSSLCGGFVCLGYGIAVTKEKQTVKKSLNTQEVAQIYPNPVAATGIINISFRDAMAGFYQVRFLNDAGQLFYSVQKNIMKAETEQIQLSSKIIPGFYVVQIVNEKKQLFHSSKLLVR